MKVTIGVEFGARMITIDNKLIELQIWDTVIFSFFPFCIAIYTKFYYERKHNINYN